MKQQIRIRAWISTANLINPRKLFIDQLPRYYLAIHPEDSIVFDELKDHVDQRNLRLKLLIHNLRVMRMKSLMAARLSFKPQSNLF